MYISIEQIVIRFTPITLMVVSTRIWVLVDKATYKATYKDSFKDSFKDPYRLSKQVS